MNPVKYVFTYTDKSGHHTGEAADAAELRRRLRFIQRSGGDIEPESVRVVENKK